MATSGGEAHQTVLLREAVDALVTSADGLYVDGTFGRGGHTALILERLSESGRLIVVDKDIEAIEEAKRRFADDGRVSVCHGSFASVAEFVEELFPGEKVDGVLLDLGVSSPQLDDRERGFSFLGDGPLDMRMDQTQGESAADWLNRADEEEIKKVLKELGEERFSGRIARNIVEERGRKPFSTTSELADLVSRAVPAKAKEKNKHPATRTFQAVRIFINNELGDLQVFLDHVTGMLKAGGRMVVISFHSLEDRMVKQFIRTCEKGPELPRGLPVKADFYQSTLRAVGKAVKPGKSEVENNIRARSAVMRVAERV